MGRRNRSELWVNGVKDHLKARCFLGRLEAGGDFGESLCRQAGHAHLPGYLRPPLTQ